MLVSQEWITLQIDEAVAALHEKQIVATPQSVYDQIYTWYMDTREGHEHEDYSMEEAAEDLAMREISHYNPDIEVINRPRVPSYRAA